jgi:hypothetical protein
MTERVNHHPHPAGDASDWFANPVFDIYDVASIAQDDAAVPGSPSGRVARIDVPSTDKGLAVTGYDPQPNLTAGVTYIITAWAWSPSGSPDFTVDIPFHAAPGEWCTTKGEWASAACAFTPSSSGVYNPALRIPATDGGPVYFAGMTIEVAGTPAAGLTYFDGDTPGASWDGTPGASVSRLPVSSTFAAILPPARTLGEVIAGSHRTLTRAVIVAGPAAGEALPVTGGGVSVDFDADVTRSGRVTVAGLPQWEPVDATDALDVRAGTEIRLEQGVTDDAGVEHWWSQGVFRPSKPTVTRDGGGLSIAVDLHDRSYSVKLASIRRRWVIAADAPMLGSIATVLAEVAPWLPLNIDTTGDFPAGADIVVCEYGGDVWAAARQLAQSMGRWLHVDRDGVCVAPAIADPYQSEAAALPALTSEQVGTDTSTIVNVVGATWTEPRPDDAPEGWVPEGGVEEWVDRESSTSIDSAVGVRARAYSGDASVLHTPSHAAAAALSDGLRLRDLARAAQCTVVPDPRLDVGGAVTLDGYTYRVTKLDIGLAGDTATGVDLGTARPDMARLLGAALRPGQERRLIEVVTSVSPLRTRPIYEEGSEASVRWTDALAGVAVGDRVVVLHKGMGERVGVSLLDPKPLTQKFAGEVIGTVGGDDVTVGGDVTLRARVGSGGSYQTFSNGDVTLPEPAMTLNWSYVSQSVPGSLGAAGSVTLAAFNEDRERINDLRAAVSYINGRLVNLEANNT